MVEEDFVCRDWAAACLRALKRNFGGLAEAHFRQISEAKWYTHYIARHLLPELTTTTIGEIPACSFVGAIGRTTDRRTAAENVNEHDASLFESAKQLRFRRAMQPMSISLEVADCTAGDC